MRTWKLLFSGGALLVAAIAILSLSTFDLRGASANPLSGFVSIDAGEDHTCAIMETGGVKCWGSDFKGRLGHGSPVDGSFPIDTADLGRAVVDIGTGDESTCVVLEDGTVRCWGENAYGQIAPTHAASFAAPVIVEGLSGPVVAVAGGAQHTCALMQDGSVNCWGDDSRGQMGSDGGNSCKLYSYCAPAPVLGIDDAVDIAVGSFHSCAVVATGSVVCWGANQFGSLGDDTAMDRDVAVHVLGLSNATDVAAGADHTCALIQTGAVMCWGNGYRNTPTDVPGLETGVKAIEASQQHTCALMTSGGVECWGSNAFGQLGDGGRCGMVCSAPVDVVELQDVIQVATGVVHSCALLASGTAKCWGANNTGQLGDGRGGLSRSSSVPVDVAEAELKPLPTPTACAPEGCPAPTASPAPPQTGLDFSISIDNDADGLPDCRTSAGQTTNCSMASGSRFAVLVTLHALPPGVAHYEGFDFYLGYAGIASEHKDDFIWPECGFPASFHGPDFEVFGCAAPVGGVTSSYLGPVANSLFTCADSGSVTLMHGVGRTDLVLMDTSEHYEALSGGEQLIIDCGTVVRSGDVNCSVAVDSVDAQLMLQHHAKLLALLGCPQFADVNIDRTANSIDAALVLQYTVGLVASLPVIPRD